MSVTDEVLDQWDFLEDAADLGATLDDACAVAQDHGALPEGTNVRVRVVPCVPGAPILDGARVSGCKVARIDGEVAIWLFVKPVL